MKSKKASRKAKDRPRETFVYVLIIIAAVAITISLCFVQTMKSSRDSDRRAIRRAVLSSATECAAVEGSYPEDVEYLERNYGLRYNHDQYIVIYEPMGNNVAPQVTVLDKKSSD